MSKSYLKRKTQGKSKSAFDCVLGELKVLQTLQHPNIIWIHEIINDPNQDCLYIISDYYSRGSLLHSLEEHQAKSCNKSGLPTKELRLYFIDMLKALYYCHNIVKVIHRDIKPDNIMLNHNQEAVLIDFGVSSIVEREDSDQLKDTIGTLSFYAPEMINSKKSGQSVIRGEKTDLWALGITFY